MLLNSLLHRFLAIYIFKFKISVILVQQIVLKSKCKDILSCSLFKKTGNITQLFYQQLRRPGQATTYIIVSLIVLKHFIVKLLL